MKKEKYRRNNLLNCVGWLFSVKMIIPHCSDVTILWDGLLILLNIEHRFSQAHMFKTGEPE